MKNNEKYTVGYSVLNPATNSDSDSTKSNGARVVSPSIHTHVDEKGQSGLSGLDLVFLTDPMSMRKVKVGYLVS